MSAPFPCPDPQAHPPLDEAALRRRGRAEMRRVLWLLLAGIIPAAFTVAMVTEARPFAWSEGEKNPTPFGYTYSLGMFLVPCFVFGLWLLRLKWNQPEAKAFTVCLVVLPLLGFLLDLGFASLFLEFPNREATLQWMIPGMKWSPLGWGFPIPVEEFVFYISGFICVLALYVWASEVWCEKYQVQDAYRKIGPARKLVRWHPWALLVGAGLVALACAWKFLGPHAWREGFPGYFTFLVAVSVAPTILLLGVSVAYINWQAFSLALFYVLALSILWEALLGVPYRWWGYEEAQMVGLYVLPASRLPIEAVLVWIAVTWTTVSLYEACHLWYSLTPPERHELLHGTAGLRHIAPAYARAKNLPPASEPPRP